METNKQNEMLYVTVHKSRKDEESKMDGIASINTNPKLNPFCVKMRGKDTICKSCYSKRYEYFPNMAKILNENTNILLDKSFTMNCVPNLNRYRYVRLHSFGELINSTHYKNILTIVKAYPNTTFTLWTKRKEIVQKETKPSNLILIYSSPKLNKISALPDKFDKVFTVFDKDKKDIDINCQKKCIDCLKCYTYNNTIFINEVKKYKKR